MKSLFVLILIINLLSCGDDGPNCPGDIVLPISILPKATIYNIGDTITVFSKIYKLIYDQKTEKLYDASSYRFAPIISFYDLDSSIEYNGSQMALYCDYIMKDSSKMYIISSERESAIVGEYSLENDSLYFIINLKLKKKGYYWLHFESLSSGDSHLQNNYKFNCRGREITFNLEFSGDGNIELMQKFRSRKPNDFFLADSISRFYNHAGYCFEVR